MGVLFPFSTLNSFDVYMLLTRSGEWGDHVTLQAAADSVLFALP